MLDLNLFFSVKPVILNNFFTVWILKSESVGVSATYHFGEPTDRCFLVSLFISYCNDENLICMKYASLWILLDKVQEDKKGDFLLS